MWLDGDAVLEPQDAAARWLHDASRNTAPDDSVSTCGRQRPAETRPFPMVQALSRIDAVGPETAVSPLRPARSRVPPVGRGNHGGHRALRSSPLAGSLPPAQSGSLDLMVWGKGLCWRHGDDTVSPGVASVPPGHSEVETPASSPGAVLPPPAPSAGPRARVRALGIAGGSAHMGA